MPIPRLDLLAGGSLSPQGAQTAPQQDRGGAPARGADPVVPAADGAPAADSAAFSPEALAALRADAEARNDGGESAEENAGPTTERGANGEPLSPEEEEQVRELRARDREVRAHEQAHKAVAGDLATSGPTYTYERGPDGVDYAVGGEVGIALRQGDTPQETLNNAMRAQRAAMAPAEPSAQDRAVAAEAAQMAAEARSEIQTERAEERSGESAEGDFELPEIPEPGRGSVAGQAAQVAGSLLDLFA